MGETLAESTEQRRLEVLHGYGILDTPREDLFERLTTLASQVFDVPYACVALVDQHRVWFKSGYGVEAEEVKRSPGFCSTAIESDSVRVVEDARLDPIARKNPLVTGDFGLRFYAGAPVRNEDGVALGTFCIMDRQPREFPRDREVLLEQLADYAMLLIERFRIERELERAREHKARLDARIQKAQKIESLGVLAGGVAHDFNNLLVGVLGNATLLEGMLDPDHEGTVLVKRIEHAARSAAELCDQMMDYSGKGTSACEITDLNEIVRGAVELVESAVTPRVACRTTTTAQTLLVSADRVQLEQVAMNIITNAAESYETADHVENRDVQILTGTRFVGDPAAEAAVADPGLKPAEYAYIRVTDTGCGMSEETQARLFEPFYSTKFTGRGLGLAATLGIVRNHDGWMRIDTEPGSGTTFEVLLPIARSAAIAESDVDVDAGVDVGASEFVAAGTALVVDDEAGVREVVTAMLSRMGFCVVAARNGAEALERVDEQSPAVVLLDVTMPGMSGFEVIEELERRDIKAPVVMMTGQQDSQVLEQLRYLANQLVRKPFDLDELRVVVRDAIQGAN